MASSSPALRVAIAQIDSVLGPPEANLERHLDFVRRARAERAELLLFPEMSLTGHSAGSRALDVAIPRDHALVGEIARASGPMTTVFGMIEESVAAQFHNTALAVRDGGIVFEHRKVNLATYGLLDDHKHFSAGRFVETFALRDGWRGSVLICNDLFNPALVHLAAVHGATILLAPISSGLEAVGDGFDNPASWDLCGRFFSMVYGLPVLLANRVGQEGALTFWGGSSVFDAAGKPVERLGDDEGLLISELDYEQVRRARYALPTVRDSNLDLIKREVDRLADRVGVPDFLGRGGG